ncbi:serine/threonine-protein kinase [Fibrivirga algicola]|uniref:Serine/threonine protein kinase n=1 Tax=Fibrivirga algicola TaxID=2950420 RepID=A0ABX0QNL1_9BACT|nr:serine/threonine-protein kinase [Fibrivirga algicola]NID12373.1 serine/threonine protein kinase [Fibrivirga algicola]
MPTVSFNTNFPGYDVLGEIGRSNARVLKARHLATGDLVAIKHFALNTDADTLRRFERESEIMSRMSHPNIVRVREVRLNADLPYIVLDYIEGGTVRQLITEQGCLSVELTIRLGLQMVDAFRQIHAQGIIHRDVKPENILYHRMASGELHFLLTDFGVARLHEQPVTMTGQSLMTYEYAAPEQFDNPRNVTESVDYYALGVVFYECLTGKVPFAMRGETGIVTFMNAVLTTPPPTPVLHSAQPIPGSLASLLKQLLIKKPTERLYNPDIVRLALKQAEVEQLQVENGQTSPPSISRTEAYRPASIPNQTRSFTPQSDNTPAQPTQRRRSGLLPILLLVAALILGGVAAFWYVNQEDKQANPTREALESDPFQGNADPRTTDDALPPKVIKPSDAEVKRLAAEAAIRRFDEQVATATKQLNAETFGGKTRIIGGVKGLNVQLSNPSAITFSSVRVRVRYYKESGDLFKSTTMYFTIGPNATVVRKAPDSPRGTRFSADVIRADAVRPDSLAADTTQTP